MTLAYAEKRFDEALPDIETLITPHWAEVGSYKEEFARQIDFSAYRRLEAAGRLLTVVAHDQVGALAAYFVGVTANDLHRVTRTTPPMHVGVCSALVYYIVPAHRGRARGFVRAVEACAIERGCSIINFRVKPGMNRADEFLAAIGYSVIETTYSRLIGDAAHAGSQPPAVD